MDKTIFILTTFFAFIRTAAGYGLNDPLTYETQNEFHHHPALASDDPPSFGKVFTCQFNPADGCFHAHESVLFSELGNPTDLVSLDSETGTFIVSEAGNYLISYTFNLFGGSVPIFGIQLNRCIILPGTNCQEHPTNMIANGMRVKGLVVANLSVGDQINIINQSQTTIQFSNHLSGNHNGCLVIRKLH